MSQFFQVTSLEELHRIYPNLQFDNENGVPSVIQDDQSIQYIDGQGQQVITSVESSGMQFSSPAPLQQCHLQQSQFTVHQPAQYVIHQIDSDESQQTSVQYIHQRPQPSNTVNKKESHETQFQDQNVGCTAINIGEEHSVPQRIVKAENSQQYASQVQPILHQPIQIHQQISGGNILEISSQDQSVVSNLINSHKSFTNLQDNLEQKNSRIIKHKQITAPNNQIQENQDCDSSQIMHNAHVPHSHSNQQHLMHQSRQQILQSVRYYNQSTVIDSFSPSSEVVDKKATLNENVPQTKQHVILPQGFEISNQSAISNRMALARKPSQQEIDGSVFLVEEVESPFLIRDSQPKICFQSSMVITNKSTENASTQSIATQNEQILIKDTSIPSRQEVSPKINISVASSQENFSNESQRHSDVKIENMEPSFGNKGDQTSKMKVFGSGLTRPVLSRNKTAEQQTGPLILTDSKNTSGCQFPRFSSSVHPRLRGPFPQIQSPSVIQSQNQTPGRGRGARGFATRGGHQYVPRARGTQVQKSPPRPSNIKGVSSNRGGKSPQIGRGAKGEFVSKGPDERQGPFMRTSPQVIQNVSSKDETSQVVNESTEEARMVVLLGNGEKKIVKIPCSQNILIGQLLQQAGIPVSTNTPFTIEQVSDTNAEHFIIKSCPNVQKIQTPFKGGSATPIAVTPNSLTSRSIVGAIQQRPRIQSHSPNPTNISLVRHSLQLGSRMTNCPRTPTASSAVSDNQNAENSTPPLILREEPRYLPGLMAICPFCGISSLDFNKCIRCRRKLPESVKSHPIFSQKKKKTPGLEKIGTTDKESKCEGEVKQSDLFDSKEKTSPGSDRKKPKLYPKKKKIHDEPTEILILSSDEEEDNKSQNTILNPPTLSKLKKEPDYSDIKELEMAILSTDGSLNEDLMKNVQPGSFTTINCRTIRIGSFKIQPKERVFVSAKGIRLAVHTLKNEPVVIIIPVNDVVKALIHFGKQIPVIFLYPLPKVAEQIRKMLGMENKNGPYYDPTSNKEESHKRITILLEKITEDNKMALHKVFANEKLEELSEKEANEILLRASPIDLQSSACGKIEDSVKKIMVYPPPPEKGGITLNNQDYACLGEDQFLNDVIIDFYLKYLMLKVLSPTDRNRTHVFSTFFYKRLTTKPKRLRKNDPENDPKLSPAEKRHMRVKGWTKQVNLFEKDFVIVPINEHSHWFLAIICFPGLTGPVRFSDNTPIEPEEIAPKKKSPSVRIGNTTITHIMKSDGSTINLGTDSSSDRDEAEGDQDDLHPSTDDESEQAEEESNSSSNSVQIPLLTPSQPPQPLPASPLLKDSKVKFSKKKAYREPIKQPCILIFDSLAGASRVRVVATLRDYLKIEYKKKMGQDRDFSKDTIKGAVPKVPQQNNFTDCGLYVLQYVESFFQDPLHDFKLPLKYLQDWFPEEVVSCKRQKLANLIRSLMEEQNIDVEEMGLPQLTFGSGKNSSDDQKIEEEELEDEELNEEEEEEEEEELLRRYTHKNLSLDEENDPCEDSDEDEVEEEEDYFDDEEDDLEAGEISQKWLSNAGSSCKEFEVSGKHPSQVLFRTTAIVNYDPSDTEEDEENENEDEDEEDDDADGDGIIAFNSSAAFDDKRSSNEEVSGEKFSKKQQAVVEKGKSVPLIDYQDFESQITCTTIERSFDGSNCGSDDSLSEGEVFDDDEEQGRRIGDGGGKVFEAYEDGNRTHSVVENFNKPVKTALNQEISVKDRTNINLTDTIKKLVSDKSITISRKDEEIDSNLLGKNLGIKKLRAEDCDRDEEIEKATSPGFPDKRTLTSCKRSFQALKNVRIQKKTDRNIDLCSKRQKVDDR